MRARFLFAALLVFITGCSVNPVTGKSELVFVSEAEEIQLGQQNYVPTQQSQGGVYDVDPELTAYVQGVGNSLAVHAARDLPYEFVVLNNSVPNAWALPGGKIAINRGLLTELNSEAELAAVLGHEIVHSDARHSAQQMTRGLLTQVLVVATAVATSDSDYGDLAVGGAAIGAQLITTRYSRQAELESDHYGMRYMSAAGYDPQGAVALQETFVRLSEGRRSDWLSGLFATHPPSPERVEANRQTAASLPAGGRMGTDEYQRAMRRTMELKPAYDAYDDGREALANDDVDGALALANQALDLFQGEAHFHALRGDVRLMEDNYDWAITNYTRAIDRRGDFFYYYLQRGLAEREQGRNDAAERDLERANDLLPTAPAYYTLGIIAEDRGDIDTAVANYRVLAEAGGDIGRLAAVRAATLDIPRNPGAYLERRCSIDQAGTLIVAVINQSQVSVANVTFVVEYADASGRPQSRQMMMRGVIGPGQGGTISTGIGPFVGGSCPVRVVRANVVD